MSQFFLQPHLAPGNNVKGENCSTDGFGGYFSNFEELALVVCVFCVSPFSSL